MMVPICTNCCPVGTNRRDSVAASGAADGRYYIFQASQSSPTTVTSLWALDKRNRKITGPAEEDHRRPDVVWESWPSADKNKIWALGVQPAAEVVTAQLCPRQFRQPAPRYFCNRR